MEWWKLILAFKHIKPINGELLLQNIYYLVIAKEKEAKCFLFFVFEETKELIIWEKFLLGASTVPKVVCGWKEKVFLEVWVLSRNSRKLFCVTILMEKECEICGQNQILLQATSHSFLTYLLFFSPFFFFLIHVFSILRTVRPCSELDSAS